MKILLGLFLTVYASNGVARELTVPFKLKLISKDGKTNFKEYKASLFYECNYKKASWGNVFESPGTVIKSCGNKRQEIKINNADEVEVPSIVALDSKNGSLLKNYHVSVLVHKPNVFKSTIMELSVEGERLINKLVQNQTAVFFSKFKFTDVIVTFEGKNFFDTEFVNESRSGLIFSLNDENWTAYKKQIAVRGQNTSFAYAVTANPVNSGTIDMRTVRSISTPEITLATFGDQIPTQEVRVAFASDKTEFIINQLFVPRTVEALEAIKEIKLK